MKKSDLSQGRENISQASETDLLSREKSLYSNRSIIIPTTQIDINKQRISFIYIWIEITLVKSHYFDGV